MKRLLSFTRSQILFGNVRVPATSLLQSVEKQSFPDKRVPKYNLGTRKNYFLIT